uniref:Alpha-amylase n=1 Tax=Candidatus Kentrum eta TaxID=2126337 RepID=A0A450URQ1_9GAMM|nr:MAG: alpha-amylase [Candidatus Kentron sp. H]VFJ96068.1 MAG: alpha-amylase [Candidatus Kentron sp. H]VFK02140.1 MAG: alpha-amylase [Candidatus Kentron sp. H]
MNTFTRNIGRALLASTLFAGSSGTAHADLNGAAFVHLFEWSWADIAKECEYLDKKGYAAVQVSPPQEHIQGSEWWTRYQPVSYKLVSRSGDAQAFEKMVDTCHANNVKIYVDAIINHMAEGHATEVRQGMAGTPYQRESYSGLYEGSQGHFHPFCKTDNYKDQIITQGCNLLNMPDLRTGSEEVRTKIADYLNHLISLGVDGFRIDAAKHIWTDDIENILSRLNRRQIDGQPVEVFQEVIFRNTNEAVKPEQYYKNGLVTEFRWGDAIAAKFKRGHGTIYDFQQFDASSWKFVPSHKAVVFTDNHDDQRKTPCKVMNFRIDGPKYDLANVFMLAYPYGYPKVMSSYKYADHDQGPPSNPVHSGDKPNCFGSDWECEHRFRPIANMVAFRKHTRPVSDTDYWFSAWGGQQIGFGRGNLGYVVINNSNSDLNQTIPTGMMPGTYCNIIEGDFEDSSCSGPTLKVDKSGKVLFNVPAGRAAAIHVGAKVGA